MSIIAQYAPLMFVGATASLILGVLMIWYSKNNMMKSISQLHVLKMLETYRHRVELINAVKRTRSKEISPNLVPIMLIKLEREGLVLRTSDNYLITTKGRESLENLDSMNKEFQKMAKIIDKLSMVGKFIVSAIDRKLILGINNQAYLRIYNRLDADRILSTDWKLARRGNDSITKIVVS
jgi:DNA-binding PadR family transcriptional regulator